jgi:hypothetical protein
MQPESRKQKTTKADFLHIIVPLAELKNFCLQAAQKDSEARHVLGTI